MFFPSELIETAGPNFSLQTQSIYDRRFSESLTFICRFIFIRRGFGENENQSDDQQQNTHSARHHDYFRSTSRPLHSAITHFNHQFIHRLSPSPANWALLYERLSGVAHFARPLPRDLSRIECVCCCNGSLLFTRAKKRR